MLLRAKVSFAPDAHRVVGMGQTVDSEHPVAKAHPNLFEPVQPDIRWEQATAAPGEVRHVSPAPETKGEQIAREAEETIEAEKKSSVESPAVPLVDPTKHSLVELKTLARREGVADHGSVKEPIAERINDKRREKAAGK